MKDRIQRGQMNPKARFLPLGICYWSKTDVWFWVPWGAGRKELKSRAVPNWRLYQPCSHKAGILKGCKYSEYAALGDPRNKAIPHSHSHSSIRKDFTKRERAKEPWENAFHDLLSRFVDQSLGGSKISQARNWVSSNLQQENSEKKKKKMFKSCMENYKFYWKILKT